MIQQYNRISDQLVDRYTMKTDAYKQWQRENPYADPSSYKGNQRYVAARYSTSRNNGYGGALQRETADEYHNRQSRLMQAFSAVRNNISKATQARGIQTREQFARTRFTPEELQGRARVAAGGKG